MHYKILLISVLISIISSGSLSANEPGFYPWFNFEKANDWTTSDWNNNSLHDAALSSDFVTEGKSSLEVKINAQRPGHQGVIQVFDIGDLSVIDKLRVDIYNSSMTNMKISLMLKTGTNWIYHESPRQELKPGWNKGVEFDLKAPVYGGAGVFDSEIKEIKFVRRFGFLIEPDNKTEGILFIDNIRISGSGAAALSPEKEPQGLREVLIDDFESDNLKWSAASTWSSAVRTIHEAEKVSSGKGAMRGIFDLKSPGKNAVFMVEEAVDMSDVYEIKIDVYFPYEYPSNLTLALATGDKWVWQEGPGVRLKKGWNKDVTFNLKERRWKNEKSKWANTVLPDDINDVRRVCFVTYPPEMGEGYLILDNLRAITSRPAKLKPLMPVDISNMAFYPWNSFEKGVNWLPSTDDSGAIAAKPAVDFGGEKNKGMEISFATMSEVDKAMYSYSGILDFANNTGMKVDIYNPMDYGVKIALAFQTGDEETWIESKLMNIGPGWNRDIYFDFISPAFKSAESNWNYTDIFHKRDDIRRVFLQVYPDRKTKGSVYLADFRLARRNYFGEPGKYAGLTFTNNSKFTVEPVTFREWDDGATEGTFERETALNFWKGALMAGWGASHAELSADYASRGSKSLKLTYKDTGVKFGAVYTSPGTLDLTRYSQLVYDVYNPGKQMKVSVAMKSDAGSGSVWFEQRTQITLSPGWNKNITARLDAEEWKKISGGAEVNPSKVDLKANIKELFIIATGGFEGTLYIDNIRWGSESGMGLSSGAVEQDVNLEITPFDALEAGVTFRGAYYHEQNTELSVKSAHLTVRGYGNELSLFSGGPVNVFDDAFGLIDSGAIGPNVTGLSLAGTVHPINTSYVFSGLSLGSAGPWEPGMTFITTARLKTFFLNNNYAGVIYMNERRGYDPGWDVFTADIEQSTHVAGGDMSLHIPLFGAANLNLAGEVLYTHHDNPEPVFLINSSPPVYVSEYIGEDAEKMFLYGRAGLRFGHLSLNSFYRKIDPMFAANYSHGDYRAGMENMLIKAVYTLDDTPPFAYLRSLSPNWAAFVRNTQIMAEYDTGESLTDTYSRRTVTIDLKNDESLALYNYHLWFKRNEEGNDRKTPSSKVTGITKILLGNILTLRLLGSYNMTEAAFLNGSQYEYRETGVLTGFMEASIRLLDEVKLTASYKLKTAEENSNKSNIYAEVEANLFGGLTMILSYGEKPFTGYWYDDSSDVTVDKYMLVIKGRF